ncbi:MAG: orotate phosphoribosyltransferase, partial [Gammaproteobacteria bacterium]|nr:orotate phosphoribosyltransferase [Gammaproteobacteria bacterium]
IGVVIALDRQEKGQDQRSAVQEVVDEYGIAVKSIITMSDLIQYLEQQGDQAEMLDAMKFYRAEYGIQTAGA